MLSDIPVGSVDMRALQTGSLLMALECSERVGTSKVPLRFVALLSGVAQEMVRVGSAQSAASTEVAHSWASV